MASRPQTVPRPPFSSIRSARQLAPIVVLGLGNDILRDDAVGLRVAAEVARRLGDRPEVEVLQVAEMGLALLDHLEGHRRAVLVDSVQTGSVPPGTVLTLREADVRTRRGASPHFLGVGETLSFGRWLGLDMPETVDVVAIEVQDPYTLGYGFTPAVEAAIPEAVQRVLGLVECG